MRRPRCSIRYYPSEDGLSSAKRRAARALDESGLEQERHDRRLANCLAVEPLDRETFHARPADVVDQRGESVAEPAILRIAQRDERAAAALDEQRRLAAEEHHARARDPRGPRARTLGPRKRCAVRLRRVGRGKYQRLRLLAVSLTELAQPFDGAAERELRPAETLDEVAAATKPERLERPQLAVDGAVPAWDALRAHAFARDDPVALQ